MRCLLLLSCMLVAAALTTQGLTSQGRTTQGPTTQGSMVRILLKDGTTIIGAIRRETEESIVLSVGDEARVVKLSDIEDLEQVTPGTLKPGIHQAVVPPAQETPPPTPLAESEVGAEDIGSATIDQFFDPQRRPSQWVERYLWGVPEATSTRISLALGMWLFLGCLLHMSTVAVGITNASMVRAQLMALVVVVIAAIQAIVPFHGLQMVAFAGLDVALWLLVTQLVYQSGVARGMLMLLCASFMVLTTLLCLVGARFLVEAIQSQSL